MQGYVRKRGKNSYQITIDLPRGVDSERRQKFISIKGTKRDAQVKLAELQYEINNGTFIDPTNLKMGTYLDRWLEHAKTTVSGKTWDEYRKIIHTHIKPCIGHIEIDKLKPLHIQSYYADRLENGRVNKRKEKPVNSDADLATLIPTKERNGLSAQTVVHHHTLLHKALQDAVRWQIIRSNPADATNPPRVPKQEMKVLSQEEVKKLVECATSNDCYLPVLLAVSTGMRRGEILALRWEDVNLEAREITVSRSLEQTSGRVLTIKGTKTGKNRVIPISPRTVRELINHKGKQAQEKLLLGNAYEDNGLVCCKPDGTMIIPDVLTSAFFALVNDAGVTRIRFHDLRHTHVALLIAQGEHAKVISERLGHATISITMDRYGHLFPSLNRSAADRFDEALGW